MRNSIRAFVVVLLSINCVLIFISDQFSGPKPRQMTRAEMKDLNKR